MPSERIKVWVQRFPDRRHLVLQWHDPETGKRKSLSAGAREREGGGSEIGFSRIGYRPMQDGMVSSNCWENQLFAVPEGFRRIVS